MIKVLLDIIKQYSSDFHDNYKCVMSEYNKNISLYSELYNWRNLSQSNKFGFNKTKRIFFKLAKNY